MVSDDKEKILGDGHTSPSHPASPAQPLSPRGKGQPINNPYINHHLFDCHE